MQVGNAISILEKTYGVPSFDGKLEDPLDVLILTILSQNTNDVNRDRAFAELKKNFPTWDEIARATEKNIAKAIRVGGLANIKGARIRRILKEIKKKSGSYSLDYLKKYDVEGVISELQSFDGVGEKTVKCVLLFGLGGEVFPVDTHIHRLCRRMGFVRWEASREETHRVMAGIVPQNKMYSFHLNLISHGRKVCTARKAMCDGCPLTKICPKITERPSSTVISRRKSRPKS